MEHVTHVGDAGEVGQVAGAHAAQVSATVEVAATVAESHATPLHDVDQLVAVLVLVEATILVWLPEAKARDAARDAHGVQTGRGVRVCRGCIAVRGSAHMNARHMSAGTGEHGRHLASHTHTHTDILIRVKLVPKTISPAHLHSVFTVEWNLHVQVAYLQATNSSLS